MEPDPQKKKEWKEILSYMDSKDLNKGSSMLCFRDCKLYEKLLRFVTNDETLRIDQCTCIQKHDGMYFPTASIVHRYNLRGIYENKTYVGDIIVKIRNDNTDRSKFRIGLLHENEMFAYKDIIPVLEKFCEGRFPSPLIFYARRDVFVIEFLGNRRYYPVHRTVQGLRHKYMEPVLKSLAKFHSASLVCKFKQPEKFLKIENLPKEVLFYYRKANIVDYMELYLERLMSVYNTEPRSDEFDNIIKTLTSLREHSTDQIKRLVSRPKEYDVFCHGDLRVCNILIKNTLEEASFIDFQQICRSSVARDLVTLFYVNLKPEELHHCTQDYLKSYWIYLHMFLKQQEIDLESTLTEEWLNQEMKRFQVYGIVYGLWHIAEFYIDNRKEKKTLHKLSELKCGNFDFTDEFYARAKSLLLYYIKQVPLDEPSLITKEELKVTDDELGASDEESEETEATDEESEFTTEKSEVTDEEGNTTVFLLEENF